jgi:hypothetical protein
MPAVSSKEVSPIAGGRLDLANWERAMMGQVSNFALYQLPYLVTCDGLKFVQGFIKRAGFLLPRVHCIAGVQRELQVVKVQSLGLDHSPRL